MQAVSNQECKQTNNHTVTHNKQASNMQAHKKASKQAITLKTKWQLTQHDLEI